jgi:hypothetical protein
LAVESMVREAHGFSENAYFPRLRRLMSRALPEISTNPFEFSEFEAIWRAIARDLRSIPGFAEACITFRFGVDAGVNKARAFPLSQALLTLEDLRAIASGRRDHLRRAGAADVWRTLRQLKSRLSRRAQRLIGLGLFRERISAQVIAFAHRTSDSSELATPARKVSSSSIIVFRDTSDWFASGYRAFLQSADGEKIFDEPQIDASISSRVRDGSILILVLGELGDCWLINDKTLSISPGESFLVIARSDAIQATASKLLMMGVNAAAIDRAGGSLGARAIYSVAQYRSTAEANEIFVRDGKVVGIGGSARPLTYEWLGGIAVDARKTRFLRAFLPTDVRFDSGARPLRDVITVNDRYMSFTSFRKMIEEENADAVFELGFAGGRRARLAIAVARFPSDRRIGYLVDVNGRIAVEPDEVTSEDFAIVGFSELQRPASLDLRACGILLAHLRARAGDSLPADCAESLARRVRQSATPAGVRAILLELLQPGARLPSHIVRLFGVDA